jgi:hypothetical protein
MVVPVTPHMAGEMWYSRTCTSSFDTNGVESAHLCDLGRKAPLALNTFEATPIIVPNRTTPTYHMRLV